MTFRYVVWRQAKPCAPVKLAGPFLTWATADRFLLKAKAQLIRQLGTLPSHVLFYIETIGQPDVAPMRPESSIHSPQSCKPLEEKTLEAVKSAARARFEREAADAAAKEAAKWDIRAREVEARSRATIASAGASMRLLERRKVRRIA